MKNLTLVALGGVVVFILLWNDTTRPGNFRPPPLPPNKG